MNTFTKFALTIPQQVDQWINRGLNVTDRAKAEHFLSVISYYRLSAYTQPFQIPESNHQFKPGTTFDDILTLYTFDRELRLLVMDAIERIEVALRTHITNHMSVTHKAPHWYLDNNFFRDQRKHTDLLYDIGKMVDRSKELFIKHYQKNYTNPILPPIWMTVELLSMGTISKLYDNLSNVKSSDQELSDQKNIAKHFNIPAKVLCSWSEAITYTRNLCAHHSRLWNREYRIPPIVPNSPMQWIRWPIELKTDNIDPTKRVYLLLVTIEYLLQAVNQESTWHWRLKHLLERYPGISKANMGMPEDWLTDGFWRFKGEVPLFHS